MVETDQNLAPDVVAGALKESKSGKRWRPLVELTLARIREFVRQPEAVFWVFGFPLLLAFALGIAFRDTAPEKLPVAVESVSANAAETAAAISRSADLRAVVMAPAEAAQALRTGRVALVVRSTTGASATSEGASPEFD